MSRNGEIYTVNGFTGNLKEIAKRFNVDHLTLCRRMNKLGWSIEKAVNTPVIKRKENGIKICTINGFTGNLKEIAEHFNINYRTLCSRINKGMSIEDAVNIPIKDDEIKIYTVNGFTSNLKQISKNFNINYDTLRNRINKQGMSIEEAVNTPVEEKGKIYTVNEFTGNLTQISKHFGINRITIKYRLEHGFTIEEAVFFQKEYYGQKTK